MDLFIRTPEPLDVDSYYTFLLFEPASFRATPDDILFSGEEVFDIFQKTYIQAAQFTDKKGQILFNQLSRIEMMLSLVSNPKNIVMTRFIHKVWRKYPFFSNLGERFLSMPEFKEFLPEYKDEPDKHLLLNYNLIDKTLEI